MCSKKIILDKFKFLSRLLNLHGPFLSVDLVDSVEVRSFNCEFYVHVRPYNLAG